MLKWRRRKPKVLPPLPFPLLSLLCFGMMQCLVQWEKTKNPLTQRGLKSTPNLKRKSQNQGLSNKKCKMESRFKGCNKQAQRYKKWLKSLNRKHQERVLCQWESREQQSTLRGRA
jgi:hypothetical protein